MKSEHPNFLFIITNSLFSLSHTQRIIKNVNFCMSKGINVFGIGVGVSPFGIEKLFPSVIYSIDPNELLQGIATCFSGISNNCFSLFPSNISIQILSTPKLVASNII